jgi:hypothetical protein
VGVETLPGSEPLPSVDSLRTAIRAQHHEIRSLAARLHQVARQAFIADREAVAALPGLCHRLLVKLDRHLAFEETYLVPVLLTRGNGGPGQADRLMTEHARQRGALAALAELGVVDDPPGTAFALQSLLVDLMLDMPHEEHLMHELT